MSVPNSEGLKNHIDEQMGKKSIVGYYRKKYSLWLMVSLSHKYLGGDRLRQGLAL